MVQSLLTRIKCELLLGCGTLVAALCLDQIPQRALNAITPGELCGSTVLDPVPCDETRVLAVYRVMFGVFIYFLLGAVALVGVKDSTDIRSPWHNRLFVLKFFVLWGLVAALWSTPNDAMARVGHAFVYIDVLFLVLQAYVLYDAFDAFNRMCMEKYENDDVLFFLALLVVVTLVLCAAVLAPTVFTYMYYAHGDECKQQTAMVSVNLVLVVLVGIASLVGARGFTALAIAVYSTFLVWSSSSLSACNQAPNQEAEHIAFYVAHAVFTSITLIWLMAKNSPDEISVESVVESVRPSFNIRGQLETVLVEEGDDERAGTQYSYSLFNFILAVACAHIALLLTRWAALGEGVGSNSSSSLFILESSSTVVWIHSVSSWLCFVLFLWILIVPLCFPDRNF